MDSGDDEDSDVCMMLEEESDFIDDDDASEEEDFCISDDDDDDDDDFAVVDVPPAKKRGGGGGGTKKTAAATAASKSKSSVLSTKDSALNVASASSSASSNSAVTKPTSKKKGGGNNKKTIEETYQKKTQLEHILLRPDTYIGSTERDTQDMYVLDGTTGKIIERSVTFTPGLYKIFDEIVVNAADNKQRDPNMDKLDIKIDPSTNTISVKNNGDGIPIQKHKQHKCYVPTLIFGQLLTGSNFDDDEKKTTGGRNGYGAKLANVFSTQFTVECVDSERGLKFCQVFRDNMSVAEDPVVKNCSAAEKKKGDYVQITFSPDLERFKMTHLDEDAVALLSKRAYDIAGTMCFNPSGVKSKKLQVSLNDNKLPIKSFKDYLELFDGLQKPVAYEKTDRWEVGIAVSQDATPHQVSFVNSICTSKGGGHVTYIQEQVSTYLLSYFKKRARKTKLQDIKPAQVKNHMTIYVNCLIENPTFDSQTKENCTTKPRNFGSSCKLSDKFLKSIEKSDLVATIENFVSFKEREALKRKGGTKKSKITGITKLDDANKAGTAASKDCTLIITEGDSAKSLAMSGLSVVGRDYYGVFPLRGKPMNVRDESLTKVSKNEEIKNLVEIMGLKYGFKYDAANVKTLRYGHLMIMADQDTDGSHIKGLVINFIHNFWPELLDVPGFLQQFITPIVKVSKGKRSQSFFTIPEYHNWLESTGNNGKGFKIKYYKGLGTSTSAEAKEYFSNLDLHEVTFGKLCEDAFDENNATTTSEDDDDDQDSEVEGEVSGRRILPNVKNGSDLIEMVFKKDRVPERKVWLNAMKEDTYMDYQKASLEGADVKYSDFINKEYILFSNYDNERSIPHVMDGLKPSQRKVLFSCFKRKLKNEIKVAQLTGYVAEHSAYHHGEASLQQTIVMMAQNFVGSNNINLLTPSGQFGTRRMGGKDAASPRYIFTKLEPIARAIFHPDDDELLTYLNDDGVAIEPQYYVPVIPLVLVNGSDGIGTGWSSSVVNYNPRDILANLRRKINEEEVVAMSPYYSGFTGEISAQDAAGKYTHRGKIERANDTTLVISELPIKKWTQDYKQFLEGMMLAGTETKAASKKKKGDDDAAAGKKVPDITDFTENHTDTTVSFTITATKANIDKWEKEKKGLYGKFKMEGSLSTCNMHLFDPQKKIAKYNKAEDILNEFYRIRFEFYMKRKAMLVAKLQREQRILSNKARFVEEVCSGELVVSNRKRRDILADLQERKYESFPPDNKKKGVTSSDGSDDEANDDDDEEMESSEADMAKGYEYLLGMKIWSLTYEKAEALRRELADKTQELTDLQATEPSQLWLNDLDAIEEAMDLRDAEMAAEQKEQKAAAKKNQKRRAKMAKGKGKAARGKKKKKADEWDSDDEDDDSSVGSDFFNSKKPAAPARKPAARKPVSRKPAPAAKKPSIDDDDVGELSLMERLQKKAAASARAASSDTDDGNLLESMQKIAVSPQPKKRSSPKHDIYESGSDSSGDELDVAPAKKKAVAQELKRSKKPAAASLDVDVSMDSNESDDVVVVDEKPKPKKKAAKKKPATKKKAPIELDSDDSDGDEELFDFNESSDESPPAKKPAARVAPGRRGAGRNTKKINYAPEESDESGSDESDFEF